MFLARLRGGCATVAGLYGSSHDAVCRLDSRVRGNDGRAVRPVLCGLHSRSRGNDGRAERPVLCGLHSRSRGNDGENRRNRMDRTEAPCATAGAGLLTVAGSDPRDVHGAPSWRERAGRPVPVAAPYLHAGNPFRNFGSTMKIPGAEDVCGRRRVRPDRVPNPGSVRGRDARWIPTSSDCRVPDTSSRGERSAPTALVPRRSARTRLPLGARPANSIRGAPMPPRVRRVAVCEPTG